MTPWIYSKADKSFWTALKLVVVYVLLVSASLIVTISSPTYKLAGTILYISDGLFFVALIISIWHHTKHRAIEEMINRDLAKLQVKRVNNYDISVVQDGNGLISYIFYQDRYYFHDGQKDVYRVHTSNISPDVKWYKIIFEANGDDSIHVICEKTKDKNVVSVYK